MFVCVCLCVCVRVCACLRGRAGGVPVLRSGCVRAQPPLRHMALGGRSLGLHRAIRHAPSGGMKQAHDALARCDVRVGLRQVPAQMLARKSPLPMPMYGETKVSHPGHAQMWIPTTAQMWPGRVPSLCRWGRDTSERTGAESAAALVRRETVPIYGNKRTGDWIKGTDLWE